jgi:two-component system KDP operon response regulator KdpE
MPVVVIVDEDERSRRMLARQLQSHDYVVDEAKSGLEALRRVYALRPDAVVLDARLSGMETHDLTRVLRAISDEVAIIVLARQGDASDAVRMLDAGADDYVQFPSPASEVVARVRAAVRRVSRQGQGQDEPLTIRSGELMIDREARLVTKRGEPIALTPTEYRLLEALALRIGKVVPHRVLLSAVWGDEFVDDTHYLRIYVGYLRRKLEDAPSAPRYLLNEWGTGYRMALVPPVDTPMVDLPAALEVLRDEGESPLRRLA